MDFSKMTNKQIARVVIANKIAAKEMTAQNELAYAELRKRGVKGETVNGLGAIDERAGYTKEELDTKVARIVLTECGRLAECLKEKVVGPQYVTTITKK